MTPTLQDPACSDQIALLAAMTSICFSSLMIRDIPCCPSTCAGMHDAVELHPALHYAPGSTSLRYTCMMSELMLMDSAQGARIAG